MSVAFSFSKSLFLRKYIHAQSRPVKNYNFLLASPSLKLAAKYKRKVSAKRGGSNFTNSTGSV